MSAPFRALILKGDDAIAMPGTDDAPRHKIGNDFGGKIAYTFL